MENIIYFLFGNEFGEKIIDSNAMYIAAACVGAVVILCVILALINAGRTSRLERTSKEMFPDKATARREFFGETEVQTEQRVKVVQPVQTAQRAKAVQPVQPVQTAQIAPDERREPDRYEKKHDVRRVNVPQSVPMKQVPKKEIKPQPVQQRQPMQPQPMQQRQPQPVQPKYVTPVDERPGMIPNPMKIPEVKKRPEPDYDIQVSDDDDYDLK